MESIIDFLGFGLCAVIIFFAGKKLSFYGDQIAEKTGVGKAWIGLILMASVTSLPELMVGISSAAFVQSADLAVGDVLGSCACNLAILAVMDAFVPLRKSLLGIATPNHVMSAAFGIILIALAGAGLILSGSLVITPAMGLMSVVFIIIYLVSIRTIYRFEVIKKVELMGEPPASADIHLSLKAIVLNYVLFAFIIIVAALFLPYFADHIAEKTGLGKSFVGTLFVAVSTSLPEIAVSLAAIRMGSIDLSVGNLLGSNIFNILILALDDIFYTKGVLLKDASPAHIISVLAIVIMTAVAIIGLTFHSSAKRFRMAWDAIVIFTIYIINLVLLYKFS